MHRLKETLTKLKSHLPLDESLHLARNTNMLIRRSLAKSTIYPEVLNILAFDAVLNVSYMALKNPNCKVKRVIDETHIRPCVSCEIDESELNCYSCKDKLDYSL